MRNKERENYTCSEHICMVTMDSKERQRVWAKNSLAEVAFLERVCLVILGPHNSWQHKY